MSQKDYVVGVVEQGVVELPAELFSVKYKLVDGLVREVDASGKAKPTQTNHLTIGNFGTVTTVDGNRRFLTIIENPRSSGGAK